MIRHCAPALLLAVVLLGITLTAPSAAAAEAEPPAPRISPVSYTHLTLPTIYSV